MYTLIGVSGDDGQFQAVGEEGTLETNNDPPPPGSQSAPVRLTSRFMYLIGDAIRGQSNEVVIGTVQSQAILQIDAAAGVTRAILLVSDDDGFVNTVDGTQSKALPPGKYVEFASGTLGDPQDFSSTAFAGAQTLLDDARAAAEAWGLDFDWQE
jgi:hypothetical protein